MTEPILPDDLANGLIDGTADISSLPTEFRGTAGLFAAAHQPATDAELAGMAAAMELFSTAITGTAPSTAAATSSSGVISMFGTRITKRAAIIVGCTLLVAGTAAAAAGGAVKVPFFSSSDPATTSSSVEVSTSNSTETSVESTETSVDDHGTDTTLNSALVAEDSALCTAVTASSAPDSSVATSNSIDDKLSHDASSHGKSVDAFCKEVEVEHQAGDDHGTDVTGSSIDDHGNDTGTSVETGSGKGGTGGGTGGKGGGNDTSTTVSTSVSAPGGSTVTTVDDHGGSKKP